MKVCPNTHAMQEEKKLQESRIEEEHACAICMEDQELEPIPCKNKHADLMCNACLGQIKNKTNLCPICREPLVD